MGVAQKTQTLRLDNSGGADPIVISLPTDDAAVGDVQVYCEAGTVECMGFDNGIETLFGYPPTPVILSPGMWFTFQAIGQQAPRTITVPVGAIAQFVGEK